LAKLIDMLGEKEGPMTSRELDRLIWKMLKASAPALALGLCADTAKRLEPTAKPVFPATVLTELPKGADLDGDCGRCGSKKCNQHTTALQTEVGKLRQVLVKELSAWTYFTWRGRDTMGGKEFCAEACSNDLSAPETYLKLKSGEFIRFGFFHTILNCEVAPVAKGATPASVVCEEQWTPQAICMRIIPGRRPEGFLATSSFEDSSTAGELLARMAALEAASVPAFLILRDELLAHGAPTPYVALAERFAADEVRHASLMTALARRYRAEPVFTNVPTRPVRALGRMAAENAVEGCVRETFGAVVAHWQARHASDPVVRQTMCSIAEDETRHAQLAWQLDGWFRARLSLAEQRRLREARAHAVDELLAPSPGSTAHVASQLGLPTGAQAAVLTEQLQRSLWAVS
jgi:hypothetical protein